MAVRYRMDPPFASRRQAAGFALILLALLALPALLAKSGVAARRHAYSAVPTRAGDFSFIHRQIFEEKSDIDILFLSTSLLWEAIDTPYVQRELSEALGREATVITLGTNWRGEDLNYTLLRDLLPRRKVRLLVFSMPLSFQSTDLPHVQSFRWLPYEADDLDGGLPLRSRLALYGEEVLGAPRRLLSAIRPDRLAESPFAADLGAGKVRKGYSDGPFVRWTPPSPVVPTQSMIYSAKTHGWFRFKDEPLNEYQMHFLRKTFELLREHQVPAAVVRVPLPKERHSEVVEARMCWPAVFGTDVQIIGVPPATLFRGMSEEEFRRLIHAENNDHFNLNGNEFFSRTITPAIIEVYVRHAQPAR